MAEKNEYWNFWFSDVQKTYFQNVLQSTVYSVKNTF